MNSRTEPWYVHLILGVVILILTIVLIMVAIVEPGRVLKEEKYFKEETRLRMDNIRQAQILWQKKNKKFTADLDSLIQFIKTDDFVAKAIAGKDTVTGKSTNPFKVLTHGEFTPESLYYSARSRSRFIVQVDTSIQPDSIINRRGDLLRVDTVISIGNRYYIEDVDGYGSIGDLSSDAKKNTASWE